MNRFPFWAAPPDVDRATGKLQEEKDNQDFPSCLDQRLFLGAPSEMSILRTTLRRYHTAMDFKIVVKQRLMAEAIINVFNPKAPKITPCHTTLVFIQQAHTGSPSVPVMSTVSGCS